MNRRLDDLENGRYIDLAKFLHQPHVDAKIFFGDICGIVAPSGGGKTAWAQYMCLWNGLDTVYVSPEVSAWKFNRRNIQIMSGKDKMEVMRNPHLYWEKYEEFLDKIFCLEEPVNHHTMNEKINQIMDVCENLNVHQIVFDHMKLMDWGSDEMRFGLEEFCRVIKPWAVKNDMIVWLVNQTPKSATQKFGSNKPKKIQITDIAEASGIYQILDVGVVINTPMGINSPARSVSIGKGRDVDAKSLQDLIFRQNPKNFRFEPTTMAALKSEAMNHKAKDNNPDFEFEDTTNSKSKVDSEQIFNN